MGICSGCGNDYDKSFQLITHDGTKYTFDSFECAIQRAAPVCGHCGCRVIGHDVEAKGVVYCCANCAKLAGEKGLNDRVE